jgi:cell division protein FtsL
MEILLVLLVIVVIILLISINNKTSEQREFIYSLEQKIKELNEYVRNLSLTQPAKEKSKA